MVRIRKKEAMLTIAIQVTAYFWNINLTGIVLGWLDVSINWPNAVHLVPEVNGNFTGTRFSWCHIFFRITSLRGGILSLLLSKLLASSKLAILWRGDTPLRAMKNNERRFITVNVEIKMPWPHRCLSFSTKWTWTPSHYLSIANRIKLRGKLLINPYH